MKIFAFNYSLLFVFLLLSLSRADGDSFYTNLISQLSAAGLPASDSTIGENGGFGDTEDTALGSFYLVKATGQASKDIVPVTGLTFQKALRVQSQTAPDQDWQQWIGQVLGGTWKAGDTGLLVFSVHSVASEGAPKLKVAITSKDTATTDETAKDAISFTNLTPGPEWKTVYVPFTAPGDLKKGPVTFYFGFERQTLEIGGVAVFNFGNGVTTTALKAAIAKLPTTPAASAGGT